MILKPAITMLTLLLLAACASNIPEGISKPQSPTIKLEQVRADPAGFNGQMVRWGGEIVSVEPLQEKTQVEVVGRDLGRFGRPEENDASGGRFIARISGFLDPAVYKQGRQFTVTGTVSSTVEKAIGEHKYVYPVVDVDVYHLWEPLPPPSRYDYYPWYYDPFYDPWGYPYYWHHRPYYWW